MKKYCKPELKLSMLDDESCVLAASSPNFDGPASDGDNFLDGDYFA